MHLFVCLTSLLLTFHLSVLRANNFSEPNVHSKPNQNESITNSSETAALDNIEISTIEFTTELEEKKTIPTDVDVQATLPTMMRLHNSKNLESTTYDLPLSIALDQIAENSTVTSPSFDISTEDNETSFIPLPTKYSEKISTTVTEKTEETTQILKNSEEPSINFITTELDNDENDSEGVTTAMLDGTEGEDFKFLPKNELFHESIKTEPITPINSDLLSKAQETTPIFQTTPEKLFVAPHASENTPLSVVTSENTFTGIEITESAFLSSYSSQSLYSVSVTTQNESSFTFTQENETSTEGIIETNAVHTSDHRAHDRTQIIVGHKCTRLFQESILWNVTDGGMLALKSCPPGYQGNMYRPCFSSGKWGNVDYTECRLEHLGRMRHMIFHQVQKGMLGNMYVLADEFSKYMSSVDMKSPMDRLEAFEILNTFLKLDMILKMDKPRDVKYIQSLLYSCNQLIKKKTVLFSPGSQKNKLITEKAVEMIFDLTYLAEKALRGLLKTQKKHIAFRSTSSVILYLYRGKLSNQFPLMNFTSDYEKEDELSSYFNLEKTLERSAYALIWIKGLQDLLSTENLILNSDIAVATILSPLNSLNHLVHPPTFDIGLQLKKEVPSGYKLKCGQLWNMSHLWNTEDCTQSSIKGDIVTCRCHHLGSISLLLEEQPQITSIRPSPPVGKLITVSCVTSIFATIFTLIINFLLKKRDQSLFTFILMNLLKCMASIQIIFMFGVNKTEDSTLCMTISVLLHYCFLISCCWVVAYSIYLLQRLRTRMEYVGKIRYYCAFCWLLPFVFLLISINENPEGYEIRKYCWLNVHKGILWSFMIPVTGLIVVNTIVLIIVLKTFSEQISVTHRTEICKIRNSIRAGITLLPFFAMNWFFGMLAVEDSENMGLQVIFALTNSLQGILTFVFFCIKDNKVQMLYRLKFQDTSKKPKVSAMRLKKSGSFPILERPLISLTDDSRRNDNTPLLAHRSSYGESTEDPCCSNIRV